MTECAAALSRGTSFLSVPSLVPSYADTLVNTARSPTGRFLFCTWRGHRAARSRSSAPASSSTPSRPPRPAAASEFGAALFNECCVLHQWSAILIYWAHMGWDADGRRLLSLYPLCLASITLHMPHMPWDRRVCAALALFPPLFYLFCTTACTTAPDVVRCCSWGCNT